MSKVSRIISTVICDSEGEFKQVFGQIVKDNKFRGGFHIGNKEGCMILAKSDLTATEYKVMMVMLAYMDFDNYVFINQRFLSDTLEIAQPNISRTVNKLLKRGFIFKEELNGINCFRVNCVIAWKGKNTKAYRELAENDGKYLDAIDC